MSASSWGCELKCQCHDHGLHCFLSASSWGCELKFFGEHERIWCKPSAFSWGCELKYQYNLCKHLQFWVSLFVRLWVEIYKARYTTKANRCQPLREAVSWNVHTWHVSISGQSQPLREAVSWNMTCDTLYLTTRSSVSSWGCKLKYEQSYGYKFRITGNCRENFAWKNSVNGIVQCLRPVRNDHGFVALLYGSGHRSCLLLPRHGRTTAMKYVRNRCRW